MSLYNRHEHIVNAMISHDAFSDWLGIEVVNADLGQVALTLTVRKEMLNGMGIAHGAITYALADSALAFSANSHGQKAYSIETSISHLQKVQAEDRLMATTSEIARNTTTAIYTISIVNQKKEDIAFFKGAVYFSKKQWD